MCLSVEVALSTKVGPTDKYLHIHVNKALQKSVKAVCGANLAKLQIFWINSVFTIANASILLYHMLAHILF